MLSTPFEPWERDSTKGSVVLCGWPLKMCREYNKSTAKRNRAPRGQEFGGYSHLCDEKRKLESPAGPRIHGRDCYGECVPLQPQPQRKAAARNNPHPHGGFEFKSRFSKLSRGGDPPSQVYRYRPLRTLCLRTGSCTYSQKIDALVTLK